MKLFFDLLPVILFFVTYKAYPHWGEKEDAIYAATLAIMIAMGLQVLTLWLVKKKVEKMYLFSFLAILALGGLTLALRNPMFVKWKPTIVNWVLAVAFLGSQYVGEKNFVRRMLGQHFEMPDSVWMKTNLAWVAFFTISGVLNLAVAFGPFSEDTWVNFKLFGLTGLSFVFMFGLIFALRGYLAELPDEDDEDEADDASRDENKAGAGEGDDPNGSDASSDATKFADKQLD